MRKVVPPVAVVLACLMFPAGGEIVENVVHFAQNGHLAHARADEDHQPKGAEHGCNATFHVCSCHSSLTFTLQVLPSSGFVADVKESMWLSVQQWIPEDHPTQVFRPPIV